MSVDEYNDAVDQHLRELAHDARPSIAMPQEDLDQVLLDGRFKSLHETGTSGGATNVPNRERLEENVFGYPAGMPAQDRPIYGYLASPDEARSFVVDHYGRRSDTSVPASVKLKPDILDRSTVTFGDSLDATVAGRDPALMPVPAGDIDHRAASLLSQDPLEWDSLEGVFPYPEVQYHGGVRVEDIDEVVFGDSPAPDVTGRLDALGIPWSVQPGL